MNQGELWQNVKLQPQLAELCRALYQHEVLALAQLPHELFTIRQLQARLKSLPYYIDITANKLIHSEAPMALDVVNASWIVKQSSKPPYLKQTPSLVCQWYLSFRWPLGLVIPILDQGRILLDSIDRIDSQQQKFRANYAGWFHLGKNSTVSDTRFQLLKPTKAIMMAACAGHRWQGNRVLSPQRLSLRELMLSTAINWNNFKKTG
jgi:hypothetical protein